MYLKEIKNFVSDYVASISEALSESHPEYRLTRIQKYWLSFCLMGILLSNSINWSSYSRLSLGYYKIGALSWMFRHSCIPYDLLFSKSILHILRCYDLSEGSFLFDDTDNERSKNAKKIHGLGKQKDKKSGGYFLGQNLMYLVLVTKKVTIPVGFRFYENDPTWLLWKKEEDRLKTLKVSKEHRPKEVERDYDKYPSKLQLSIELAKEFKLSFPNFKVKSIAADCFFGTKEWTSNMNEVYPKTQVISQLKGNQLIEYQNKEYSLRSYFSQRVGIQTQTIVRGGKSVVIYYSSTIARVKAHGEKRLIIAYKFQGEAEYRYVFATDMSWTVQHVITTYSLRWFVEVFIADWKQYEGWAVLTKHIGFEGSKWSLILSLLFDHCLILHPEQQARIKNNLPPATVGSLREKAIHLHLLESIKALVGAPDVEQQLKLLAHNIEHIYYLRDSNKHLSARKFEFI